MSAFCGKKILIAGAGAIGCELIKCLAFEGATHMTIVDYDVISTTNLHRQALFRAADCGQLKAECAVRWVHQFLLRRRRLAQAQAQAQAHDADADADATDPRASATDVRAVVGRIESLSLADLRQFDVVLSALDDARAMRVLSRRCMLVGVAVVACNSSSRLATAVRHWTPSHTPCFDCRYPDASLDSLPKTELSCSLHSRSRSPAEAAQLAALWLADAHVKLASAVAPDALSAAIERFHVALFDTRVQEYIQTTGVGDIMRKLPLETPSARIEALRTVLRQLAPQRDVAEVREQLDEQTCELLEHVVLDVSGATALFIGALRALCARPNASESAAWLFDKDDMWHRAFVGAAATLQCYASRLQPETVFTSVSHVAPVAAASPTAAATAGAVGVLEALRVIRNATVAKGDVWSVPAFDETSDVLLRRHDVTLPLASCVACAPRSVVTVSRSKCTVGQLRAMLCETFGSVVEELSYGAAFEAVLFSPFSDATVEADVVGAVLKGDIESVSVEFSNASRNTIVRVHFTD